LSNEIQSAFVDPLSTNIFIKIRVLKFLNKKSH
jgi:hypothetical protein